MAKKKQEFECGACGAKSLQWQGRCSRCGAWDQLIEAPAEDKRQRWVEEIGKPTKLADVEINQVVDRWQPEFNDFVRVTGGGIVKGSFGLLGGAPGVGKSTLILQLLNRLAKMGKKTLYVSGEESLNQIKSRADRLLVDQGDIVVMVESNLELIMKGLKDLKADFVVIDSIQTLYDPRLDAGPGSITQVRDTAQELLRYAKKNNVSLMLVGHVTKGGDLAGPRTLEHMVDYVLYLEGEAKEHLRILRSVKNRFGGISEVGIFRMTAQGLAEVANPGGMLLEKFTWGQSGASIFAASEGTRTFFLEVQVLAGDTQQAYPARMANGMDKNRLLTLVAVLEKNLSMDFSRNDIYVNLAGGFKVTETGMDMAVMAALLSSHLLKALPEKSLFIGEVALNGQFREVPNLTERINEASRSGFKKIFYPERAELKAIKPVAGVVSQGISNVSQLIELIQ